MDFTENDSTSPASLYPSSPEELSQPYVPFAPRPSTSLPDISASYSNFQIVRRSTSERRKTQPPASQTANTFPPPIPTRPPPPTPDHSRVFPRPRVSNNTVRPAGGYFKLRDLLPKRSGREDGAETDGERLRKTKKESLISRSLFVGLCPRRLRVPLY